MSLATTTLLTPRARTNQPGACCFSQDDAKKAGTQNEKASAIVCAAGTEAETPDGQLSPPRLVPETLAPQIQNLPEEAQKEEVPEVGNSICEDNAHAADENPECSRQESPLRHIEEAAPDFQEQTHTAHKLLPITEVNAMADVRDRLSPPSDSTPPAASPAQHVQAEAVDPTLDKSREPERECTAQERKPSQEMLWEGAVNANMPKGCGIPEHKDAPSPSKAVSGVQEDCSATPVFDELGEDSRALGGSVSLETLPPSGDVGERGEKADGDDEAEICGGLAQDAPMPLDAAIASAPTSNSASPSSSRSERRSLIYTRSLDNSTRSGKIRRGSEEELDLVV